jgi:hypothetical protein
VHRYIVNNMTLFRQYASLRGNGLQSNTHIVHPYMEQNEGEENSSFVGRDLNAIPVNSTIATMSPSLSTALSSSSTSHKDTSTTTFHYSRVDTVVTCILIVLIVLLTINLVVLLYKPTRRYLRRRYRNLDHVQQKRKERRYHTIDLWLITKVRDDRFVVLGP